MDPVVHFEMPYDDRARMEKFYQSAFGWQTQPFDHAKDPYVLATTTESGPGGRPAQPGAINGGFFARSTEHSSKEQHPTVVIAVFNLKDSMQKVSAAGGKVLGEPMDIPGVGQYVSFLDTEGNRASMLEPARDWR